MLKKIAPIKWELRRELYSDIRIGVTDIGKACHWVGFSKAKYQRLKTGGSRIFKFHYSGKVGFQLIDKRKGSRTTPLFNP